MFKYLGCSHAEVLNTLLHQNSIVTVDAACKGVEVGVRSGDTAHYLLLNNPRLYLYLVDPYLPYHDVGTDITQEMQNKYKWEADKAVRSFERNTFIYQTSVEAAKAMGSFTTIDFVFIDAEHTFDACLADMEAWYPVIRKGGMLCGHDYSMTPVKKAVTKFAVERNLEVTKTEPSADVWAMEVL